MTAVHQRAQVCGSASTTTPVRTAKQLGNFFTRVKTRDERASAAAIKVAEEVMGASWFKPAAAEGEGESD